MFQVDRQVVSARDRDISHNPRHIIQCGTLLADVIVNIPRECRISKKLSEVNSVAGIGT